MAGDLDKLLPEREITLGSGDTLTVRPFFFGQLPKAIKLLRPIADSIGKAGIASFDGKNFELAGDWALKVPQVMEEGGEALLEFVAFAVGKPRAFLDTVEPDDGIALTRKVFEVNVDFFVKKIAPLMPAAVPPQATETGAPSSLDSSQPAIAGAT